MVQAYYISV